MHRLGQEGRQSVSVCVCFQLLQTSGSDTLFGKMASIKFVSDEGLWSCEYSLGQEGGQGGLCVCMCLAAADPWH